MDYLCDSMSEVCMYGGFGGAKRKSTRFELRPLEGRIATSLKSSSKFSIELSALLPLRFLA